MWSPEKPVELLVTKLGCHIDTIKGWGLKRPKTGGLAAAEADLIRREELLLYLLWRPQRQSQAIQWLLLKQ
jgi:hypothetical protein